ncbi:MAG: DNA repair exonuclease [Clostridia bacterium]|nr:MAG: DNA repair exonuclease [Clostridia bacterium]
MRFLHLADLHLGWAPRFLGENEAGRRQERDNLLARAVDYAVNPAHGIGLVVIAGDLFESHRPERVLAERVVQELRRLEEAGVQLVTVPGNHDEITYHNSVYRELAGSWPGVLVQNPTPETVAELEIQGETCHIYSLAYTGGITSTAEPLATFPRRETPGWHLGLFHGSLDWQAGDRSLPLSSQGLAQARYHYVALGHVHGHREVQLPAGPAVYAGAVESKGFSDPGVGFFTVVTLAQGGAVMEQVPAGTRPLRVETLDAGLFPTREELERKVAAMADPQAMIRLLLTGVANFPLHPASLAERLRPHFYHLEIDDQTIALTPDLLAGWAGEPTIRGLFVRRLQARLAQANTDRERQVVTRALLNGLASLESA